MSNPIVLYVDQQNQRLVAFATVNALGSSVTSWPDLFQGSSPDVQIGVVNPSGQTNPQYIAAPNLSASTMKVTICAGSPKGDGSQVIVAGPTVLAWSGAAQAFAGTLNFTLAALATAMGTSSQLSSTLEIEIVTVTIPNPIWQSTVTIKAPVDANAVVIPTPAVNYLTALESDGRYVLRIIAPGDGILFTSPNGLVQKQISLANDGTWIGF